MRGLLKGPCGLVCGMELKELKPQTGLNDARDGSPAADTVSPVTIQIENALVKGNFGFQHTARLGHQGNVIK